MMHKPIDINTWNRREIYNHFSQMKMPHYAVAGNIDVTRLLDYKREHHISFYLSFIYLATKCLNDIENFRYRIINGEVVLCDCIHTNFTHKRADEELFHFYTAPFEGTLLEYVRKTAEGMAGQTAFFGGMDPVPNVAYLSCAPNVDATNITNPGIDNPDDAIPRINWGKYVLHDGRWMLNVTLTANHRFIDRYHIGLFFQHLQEAIDQLPSAQQTTD